MLSGRGDETGQRLGEIGKDAGVVVADRVLARVICGTAVSGAPVGRPGHRRVLSVSGDGRRGLAPAHPNGGQLGVSAGFLWERGRDTSGISSGDYLRTKESKSGCFLLPYVMNKK
ncbi:hypothetical protein [Microbaculum sp. FT89]|uniref:hypothetical protein n=1 Tax=Microbaculum sp. FT89 TaxID=3447298 RepID=UPI003F529C78